MINYWRHLWRASGDSSIPGNDPIVYRVYDFLGALALLVVLSILTSLDTWAVDQFFILACTFFFGWQFAWLGRVRYARRRYREEHPDA